MQRGRTERSAGSALIAQRIDCAAHVGAASASSERARARLSVEERRAILFMIRVEIMIRGVITEILH